MIGEEQLLIEATVENISALPEIIQPLANISATFVNVTRTFLGGLFGLYLLFFILRHFLLKKQNKILMDIRNEIKHSNKKINTIEVELIKLRKASNKKVTKKKK